jgi:hypothetical protein
MYACFSFCFLLVSKVFTMEAYVELSAAARKMGGDARKNWEGVADYVLAWSSKKSLIISG